MTEWMLRDLNAATSMSHVALRYFNVAGADPGGRIGQSTANAEGGGLAQSAVRDARGLVARSAQSLVVAPR